MHHEYSLEILDLNFQFYQHNKFCLLFGKNVKYLVSLYIKYALLKSNFFHIPLADCLKS